MRGGCGEGGDGGGGGGEGGGEADCVGFGGDAGEVAGEVRARARALCGFGVGGLGGIEEEVVVRVELEDEIGDVAGGKRVLVTGAEEGQVEGRRRRT